MNRYNQKLLKQYRTVFEEWIEFQNRNYSDPMPIPDDEELLSHALSTAIAEQEATNEYNRRVEQEAAWEREHGGIE